MMSDAALVLRARGGDEGAFEALADRHGDVIDHSLRPFYASRGLDLADLRQEALVGLHKAVRDYRSDRGSGFRNFASLCVHRQVVTAVHLAGRLKHQVLTEAYSLGQPLIGAADDADLSLEEVLPADADADLLDDLFRREDVGRVVRAVNWDLSETERRSILGIIEGRSYEEIAQTTGLPPKSIDNAAQRARRKIGSTLEIAA